MMLPLSYLFFLIRIFFRKKIFTLGIRIIQIRDFELLLRFLILKDVVCQFHRFYLTDIIIRIELDFMRLFFLFALLFFQFSRILRSSIIFIRVIIYYDV